MYYINSTDNAKIAVYDLNPTSDRVVFLIHGWPLSHKMFEYQVHVLVELGYRVVSIDLRGFGNSDETASGYDYNQLATDVYTVICQLNLQDITLVGFSIGGAIAVRYMNLFKGHAVSKLSLWSAAAPSYTKTAYNPYGHTVEETNELIVKGYKDRPSLNEYFGSIFFESNPSKALRDWFQNVSNSASGIGQMKALISLRNEDVFDDLKCIQVPTGIFHGKKDKICPYDMAKIQMQNIRYSKLYTFENGGHGSFYDEMKKFNRDFVDFLQE